MNRIPNARIKGLCGVKKGLDEKIDMMKVCSGCSVMWKGWKGIGLPRESM